VESEDRAGEVQPQSKAKLMSYDIRKCTVYALLGEPTYKFVREETDVAVLEWPCGCSCCAPESGERGTVQWCAVHGSQVRHLRLT
jgi:hypothetical protein